MLVDFESCWQLDARWMEGYCGDVMKMRYWGDGGWGEDVEHSGDWVHGDGGIVVMEV